MALLLVSVLAVPTGTFVAGAADVIRRIRLLCRLDFYVHESCQRLGIGKLLLDVRPLSPSLH